MSFKCTICYFVKLLFFQKTIEGTIKDQSEKLDQLPMPLRYHGKTRKHEQKHLHRLIC